MIIELEFVNRSYDRSGWDVIIFQRDLEAAGDAELILVWKRIRRCGYLNRHPIRFPLDLTLECTDPWGNLTEQVALEAAAAGALEPVARVALDAAGEQVEVENQRPLGAIDATLCRAGRPLGRRTALAPGRQGRFHFGFDLCFASYPGAEEGETIPWAEVKGGGRCFRLHGISRARVVMVGAGPGPHAAPLSFHLEEEERW